MKHIPNLLTVFRIILVPVFLLVIANRSIEYSFHLALLIFVVAAATDWLDGFLARRWDIVSDFGKIADPLADKMLVLSALAVLAWASPFAISKAVFFIILFREALITVMREIYQRRGIVVPADHLGKLKTVMQMAGILAALSLWAALRSQPRWVVVSMNIWWWLVAGITLISGVNYLIHSRER